jgi:mRNA interferase RelE/StbE
MSDTPRYRVLFARRAVKDVNQPTPKLRRKLKEIIENRIAEDPYSGKRLVGDLEGYRSIRLTHKDRVVFRIDEEEKTVFILRARTHYNTP